MLATINSPKHKKRLEPLSSSSSKPKHSSLTIKSVIVPELKLDRLHTKGQKRSIPKPQKFLSKSFRISQRTLTQKTTKESILPYQYKYDDPQKEFESLALPVSFDTILEKFSRYLTEYEKREVFEYSKIYYLALNVPKFLLFDDNGVKFDDDLGNYNLIQGDSLGYRFEVLEIVGRGSFSQVCKCLDHKKNEVVAVKIIKNQAKFVNQANIEIRLLENINNKDLEENSNLLHIKENFLFRGHICLVFDLLSMNLYELLKENDFKGLSTVLIKKIAGQLLHSLKFLKSLHIIHCDLKPENILLKSSDSSNIRLIDLGSGCFEHERVFSYVQSRFYRAPEVILGINYTTAIDMWSLGCILAELYIANPLFPAENEFELVSMILELFDVPPFEILAKASRKKIFFDRENRPRLTQNSKGKIVRPNTKKLEEIIKTNDAKFLDFIQSMRYLECLQWDPKKRMTPEEGLRHD